MSTAAVIRVPIIEDDPSTRDGLGLLIDASPGYLCVGKFGSVEEALRDNTTLDVQADFYAANRGDNTIVRMRQDGKVVAVRRVRLADGEPLWDLRLNGIGGSPDGTRIWVAVTGHVPGMGGRGRRRAGSAGVLKNNPSRVFTTRLRAGRVEHLGFATVSLQPEARSFEPSTAHQ